MKKTLKSAISGGKFAVLAELAGGPGLSFAPIERFLKDYKLGGWVMPAEYEFTGITLPQNPGGVANLEPADVLYYIQKKDLVSELDIVPHITCKDQNVDRILSSLAGLRTMGVESLLALTGDKPVKSKGVFEIDSTGLLGLIQDVNNEQYIKARPEAIGEVHQFFPGAAVSPFKYTEASQMQQYFKMEKKVAAGAKFMITQVGWDWKKSVELLKYIKDKKLGVPVIGNVYLLSTMTPAPRLMNERKLAGCFVSDELFATVCAESVEEHIERAAEQVAMYKSIGAAGVDLGGVPDFKTFARIVDRAVQIGAKWSDHSQNLYWPPKNGYYLYDESGKTGWLSRPKKKLKQKLFELAHKSMFEKQSKGYAAFKGLCALTGLEHERGGLYKTFNAFEKSFKYLAFDCEECGDCYLPENFGLCTVGGCEKGLANAPCGDATVEGKCGNNPDKVCIGELVYNAAASIRNGRERLRIINKPRNPALAGSSSIINYFFEKDHNRRCALISIGEAVHASIPKTGEIMKQLHGLGADAFSRESGPLNYIRALIESQVKEGADYVAVNVDAFGEDDRALSVKLMREYVKLVRQWSSGVPVCIDSGNDDVLKAGLEEWYDTKEKVKQPLLNSIKIYTADKMMPLKKQYDFSFIGLLISEERPSGPGGSNSVEELYGIAKQIFAKAMAAGFKPEEIYFDSTVFPLAIDMPMMPGTAGYTYRAFETIKKIKSDKEMKGVHCSLGVSNSVRDLPGRKVGVCRAYVAKAMEYGLDAGIVNTAHRYGFVEADKELVELVDAFAKMDGSTEHLNKAMELMGKFCRANRK